MRPCRRPAQCGNPLFLLILFTLLLGIGLVPAYGNGDEPPQTPPSTPVHSGTDLSTVVQGVEDHYKELKDFQAEFVQLARILSYPEDQRSEGRVYLKRERMMRWDYKTPSQEQYFIKGEQIIFYSPDVKQARRVNLQGKEGFRSPLVFFEGIKVAEPDYIVSLNEDPTFDRSTRYILELTPRDREKTPMLKILLFVDKTDFHVGRVDQYDLHGNVTELYFRNVETNKGLADSLFIFEPPKGVEVIDQP